MLEEYGDVLGDRPDFVAEVVDSCRICHPLTELNVIRHEPDNRFLECALAANAEFIITRKHSSRPLRPEAVPDQRRGRARRVSQSPCSRQVGQGSDERVNKSVP